MDSILYKVIANFSISGLYTHGYSYGMGNVNDTYCVFFQNSPFDRYILQKVDTLTYKNSYELMENIYNVTTYLQEAAKEEESEPLEKTLNLIPTTNNELYYTDPKGGCWRAYNFIENTQVFQSVENVDHMCKYGAAFGEFHRDLADFFVDDLYEIVPNLHNTKYWVDEFVKLAKTNPCRRAKKAKKEIEFVKERIEDAAIILDMLDDETLPLRVTHNDARFNNVLMDKDSDEPVCVIDLDMVMPGSYLYDFGEAIRFGASTCGVNEYDLDNVSLDLKMFDAFTKGYLNKTSHILTEEEIDMLPFAVKLIVFEWAIKYLSDFLNGDKIYRTENVNQNLERAKNQLKLVEDIEDKMDSMKKIVKKYL